jgi:hypothetical protein
MNVDRVVYYLIIIIIIDRANGRTFPVDMGLGLVRNGLVYLFSSDN